MANQPTNTKWYTNYGIGLITQAAAASWTTSSTTITMSSTAPAGVVAGFVVNDQTTGRRIGTVSSWVFTTLTLNATATYASSGSTDTLQFASPYSYYAVPSYQASTAYTVGQLFRQLTVPTVGNERVFVVYTAGTTSVEPTWTVTKGAAAGNGTLTYQEVTGQPAMNGDSANTPAWAISGSTTKGQIVTEKTSPANYYISNTTSTNGSTEPVWNTTPGGSTTDGGTTWYCLGPFANFSAWGAPFARQQSAVASTWGAAGDTFFIAGNHAETLSTAMTITFPGTVASANQLICVDQTAAVPPGGTNQLTTAKITTTTSSNLIINGSAYIYGVNFSVGTSTGSASVHFQTTGPEYLYFDSCSLKLVTTGGGSQIGQSGSDEPFKLVFDNTAVSFGAVGQSITITNYVFVWKNTLSAIGGTVPTTLFVPVANYSGSTECRGVDFSALGSSNNLVNFAISGTYTYLFEDCKLGSSVSITTGSSAGQCDVIVRLTCSDSSATNYRYYYQDYNGTITQETVVVRSGGATDLTTPISRKMVSSANANFFSPLTSDPIVFWNENYRSQQTITIPVLVQNATLTNAQIWIEVEYLGSSGTPIATFINCRASNILTAGTNCPTDSTSTWTTTGVTSPSQISLSVTFTTGMKGWIQVRVMLAAPNTTVWFDPLAITSARQYQCGAVYVNECDDPAASNVANGVVFNQGDKTGTLVSGGGPPGVLFIAGDNGPPGW